MIEGLYRPEFSERIRIFCLNNELEISYYSHMGDYVHYDIIGSVENINKLSEYADLLEKERTEYRKTKSFLWRIFN